MQSTDAQASGWLTNSCVPGITIRRVHPGDCQALSAFYARLSPASRRARFLGSSTGIGPERALTFCTPDHMHEDGFVAVRPDGDKQEIVGHVCLADSGPRTLEVGIAVADALQGRGLGRQLFESALAWAREHNVEKLVASAFADNSRVLRLLTSAPYPAHVKQADAGLVDVTVPLHGPLPPTEIVPVSRVPGARVPHRRRVRRGWQVFWLQRPRPTRSQSVAPSARAARAT